MADWSIRELEGLSEPNLGLGSQLNARHLVPKVIVTS